MRTILALLTLQLTLLSSWAAAATISGGIFYSTDTTGTNARASRITISPTSAGTNLMAGSMVVTNNLVAGTGEETHLYYSSTGQVATIFNGTTASPNTSTNPAVKINRIVNLSSTGVSGDGGEFAAGLTAATTGIISNGLQVVGIHGSAISHSTNQITAGADDAAGIYGAADVDGTGYAIGGFFIGRRTATTAHAEGLEIAVANYTTDPSVYDSTGNSSVVGISLTALGTTNAGNGLQYLNAFGQQFDVGIGFTGEIIGSKTGAVLNADLRTDDNSGSAIAINGVHTNAAIYIKSGAGPIVIGATNAQPSYPNALLQVEAANADADPLGYIGSTTFATRNYSFYIRNGTGTWALDVVGGAGAFLTGTAAGDGVLQPKTSGKALHMGGSTKVVTVTQDDKLGFNAATPISKEGATTDIKNVLVDYGLLTDGGATPLNLDAGALSAGTATFSGNMTLGDASAATYVISSSLSGATDPTLTFANSSVTTSSTFTSGGNIGTSGNGSLFLGGRGAILFPATARLQLTDAVGVATNTAFIFGIHASPTAAPTLASATTIAPLDNVTFISGTVNPISTITAPPHISGTGGQITLIPTGIWTTGTGGNIALATTAVVGKALIMTYDSGTAKWYPSY